MIGERAIADLEFEKVLDLVRQGCLSEEGRRYISPVRFSTDEDVIASRAGRIATILSRLASGDVVPDPFVSLDPLFEAEAAHEVDYDGRLLYDVSRYISSLDTLARFEENPALCDSRLKELGRRISDSLEGDGSVKETHPLLRPLYKALEGERSRRSLFTQEFMNTNADLFQSREAVYRNERVVLPVRRDRKSMVQGYVQGASATGSTLFVEPFELVDLNNRVSLAQDEIVRMKHRILHDLSSSLRDVIPVLREMVEYVALFDFHYAFALFVKRTRSQRTVFSDSIRIVDARHPLLFDKAVPISLHVESPVRVVVLSGANAGGKTVTMKTVALFVLLSQTCGWAPFAEGSCLPLFDDVYTDIGDGQSILENFSTFSSHMANVASICRSADARSLVLLDEIGSGTDPAEGAALTDSLLDYFKQKGSMLFITSHYSQVKMHAYSDPMMLNASMEFDEGTDRPTFRVIEGLPGDSHAIAIAKRMGLPSSVIRSARENMTSSSSVSQLIASLNGKSRALDRKVTELALEKKRYEKLEGELEEKSRALEQLQLRLQETGADELRVWMKETRKRLEKLVKDVSTGAITSEKTHAVKDFIASMEDRSREADRAVAEAKEKRRAESGIVYKTGDEVYCGAFGRRGVILRDMGKGRYQVSIDSMKITLSHDDLKPAPVEKKASVSPFKVTSGRPSLVLDLRGRRLEEALQAIDDEIESCLVHSLSSFSVIHGYGNGILSQGIHEHLKHHKAVKDYYFANPEDGGMGKTYVMLKD